MTVSVFTGCGSKDDSKTSRSETVSYTHLTDAALRKAIGGLKGNMTTFLVSQRISGIRQADKILVMEDGALAGQGTHEELMKSCKTYQEIYYSQFPEERPEEDQKGVAE